MPKIVDHAARRREILARCFGLFAEQGYAALSMRGIARALEVSTGTLYYYFDSKEALFEAMIRQVASGDIAEATAEIAPGDPREARLAAVMRFVLRNADTLRQTLQVSMEYRRQLGGPADSDLLAATLGLYREALTERLGLSPAESAVALSVLIGAIIQRHLDPDAVDIGDHFALLGRVL